MNDPALVPHLLLKTSRTFALTIPLLPERTRDQVGVAYLLFRIIDTFEDATRWSTDRRIEALDSFIELLNGTDGAGVHRLVAKWMNEPPLDHPGYLELLRHTGDVLARYHDLEAPAREAIRRHLGESARGMSRYVARTDGSGFLRMRSLQDLRDYCFAVAGLVGQMLTELFLLHAPQLASRADELRERSVRFGEALQLVNILKDAPPDATEGRVYLPDEVRWPELFALAQQDLDVAVQYTELLRQGGADRGVVAFNALNTRLAIATLSALRERGLGAKLTRAQVGLLVASVARAMDTGEPLFALAAARS